MLTRDSKIWPTLQTVAIVLGLIVTTISNPADYGLTPMALRYITLVNLIVGTLAGRFGNSSLPGKDDADRVGGGRMSSFVLPFLLMSALASSACLPKTVVTPQPPVEDVQQVRAKAVEIAQAVESAGNLIVEARRATGAAYDARLITLEQRNAVYQAVIDLEPKAHALIDIAATVTTTPQLQSTVKAFLAIIGDLLDALGHGNGAMSATANAIRTALDVVFAFVGGDR